MSLRSQGAIAHYAEAPATGVNPHAAPGAVAGPVHDALVGGWHAVRASCFQDQAGSMTITMSNDPTIDASGFLIGVTLSAAKAFSTTAIVASTLAQTADVLIFRRYVQIKVTNSSGSDTTLCELDAVFRAV